MSLGATRRFSMLAQIDFWVWTLFANRSCARDSCGFSVSEGLISRRRRILGDRWQPVDLVNNNKAVTQNGEHLLIYRINATSCNTNTLTGQWFPLLLVSLYPSIFGEEIIQQSLKAIPLARIVEPTKSIHKTRRATRVATNNIPSPIFLFMMRLVTPVCTQMPVSLHSWCKHISRLNDTDCLATGPLTFV